MWSIIMFLVKVIALLIFLILAINFFYTKIVIPARENGVDLNDLSNSDSQMSWALILVMLGGLCIASDAVFKILGSF